MKRDPFKAETTGKSTSETWAVEPRRERRVLGLEGSEAMVALPPDPAGVSGQDAKVAERELASLDTAAVAKAAFGLQDMTADELDALAEFACLLSAETPGRRSWRRRLFKAMVALNDLDTDALPALVTFARAQIVATGQARDLAAETDGPPLSQPPVSPFIVKSPSQKS